MNESLYYMVKFYRKKGLDHRFGQLVFFAFNHVQVYSKKLDFNNSQLHPHPVPPPEGEGTQVVLIITKNGDWF